MMIKGCDISVANGIVDFNWLQQNDFHFVGLKCYQGNDGIDGNFAYNLSMVQQTSLQPFIYHFLYPLPNDPAHAYRSPADQAALHFNKSKGVQVVAADLEFPAPNNWAQWGVNADFIKEWTLEYLQAYEKVSGGIRPLLYTYPYFAQALQLDERFANYELWLANYSNYDCIAPWSNWTMIQTSGNGGVKLPNGAWLDVDYVNDMSIWNI